VHCAVKMYCNV